MPIRQIDSGQDAETVVVEMRGTVGYGNPKVYYGPGRVAVPVGLARMMGFEPEAAEETAVSTESLTAVSSDNQTAVSTESLTAVSSDNQTAALTDLPGVGAEMAQAMAEAGFDSVNAVANASPKALTAVSGIGQKTAVKLISAAQELLS